MSSVSGCLGWIEKACFEQAHGFNTPRTSKSQRAGLVFPVGKFQRRLKTGHYGERISAKSAVYLSAVLEYVCADVLELAGLAMKQHKKKRISERHIQLAILTDCELSQLLKHVTLPGGGVLPMMHRCYIFLPNDVAKIVQRINL